MPEDVEWRPIHHLAPPFDTLVSYHRDLRDRHQGRRPYRASTSRAVRPVCSAVLAWARPSASRSHQQPGQEYGGTSVFTGVGERTREGTDLYLEMTDSGVIEKTCLVYGQMNEPPGSPSARGPRGSDRRPITSVTRARTCCCSSTKSSASLRPVPEVHTARPYALNCGLPADAGHRDGRSAG